MPASPSEKLAVLSQGGSHDDPDGSIEEWLEFLTNPANLAAGLPNLRIAIGEWMICEIFASFDKETPSLQSLTLHVEDYGDSGAAFFRDENPPPGDSTANNLTGTPNPHHLKNWVFALFVHTELKEIDISFMIPQLPDLFDKLPRLKSVSLTNSKLERLPPTFYRLPALEVLNIVGASFPELPAELKGVSSLQRLSFSQPATGAALGGLTGLTKLECTCPAFNVPAEITQLTALTSINLSDVAYAPDNFLNFPNLEWLHLKSQRPKKFQFVGSNVPRLHELTTNNPTAFATALADFKNLKKLDLSGKVYGPDVEALTNSLRRLSNLTHFTMRESAFRIIEFLPSLTNLEYLNLFRNQLQSMPTGLDGLNGLKELHLRKNGLSEFKPLPPNLEFLDLSENQMSTSRTDLGYLQHLKTLKLHENRLRDLMKLPENLEHLTLGCNLLVRTTSGLSYLKQLKSLTLDTNRMEEIPELPVSLESFDVSKNAIVHIPSGFNKLKNLKRLKISKNPIADFPEFKPMTQLTQLEFVDTRIPESEETNIPVDEMMEKLGRIFPNAELCFDRYI